MEQHLNLKLAVLEAYVGRLLAYAAREEAAAGRDPLAWLDNEAAEVATFAKFRIPIKARETEMKSDETTIATLAELVAQDVKNRILPALPAPRPAATPSVANISDHPKWSGPHPEE